MPPYRTEAALVDHLLQHLERSGVPAVSEFNYSRGRTDVVAMREAWEVAAIEAKLTRWRDALHQAYRNTCFAHRSYVALPPATAALAVQHSAEFVARSVGILVVSEQGVEVLLEAGFATPIQSWLTDAAIASVRGSGPWTTPKRSDWPRRSARSRV